MRLVGEGRLTLNLWICAPSEWGAQANPASAARYTEPAGLLSVAVASITLPGFRERRDAW